MTTSVSEMTSVSGLPLYNQSSEASASLNIPSVTHSFSSHSASDSVSSISTISNQSMSGVLQPHSSYAAPATVSSSEKSNAGPMMHMHYGSAPAYGYGQMVVQPPRITAHTNTSYYHPSTDFQARMSPSYRHMVAFTPHRMPYTTSAGYTVCERSAVHMAGPSWSGNMQLPRQGVSMYGPPPQAVASIGTHQTVGSPSTVPDAQEPARAPASSKSKKRSRAQSKESYSSILERSVPCPNIDVRQIIQEQRERLQMEAASCSAVSVPSLTVVWTMPTTALHAASASTSQHTAVVSSHSLPARSSPFTASVSHSTAVTGTSTLFAVSEVSHTPVSMTTNVSISSLQMSGADNSISGSSLRVVTTVTSVSASPSLSYVTAVTTETSVTTVLHVAAPTSTSATCGSNWVYTTAQQYKQYNSWSQYSTHPLSCTLATKTSLGIKPYQNLFDDAQGQQLPGILPYPDRQRNLNAVLAPAVTVTASVVAVSACLPSGMVLPSSARETGKDESPIRLVQNMVSGLETTQNSLAMATSLIISQSESVPRRRKSVATEATGHIAASAATAELSEEVRFGSEFLNVDGQTNSSVQLLDDSVTCTQAKPHLPNTSAFTTVTSILTQVLPAAGVVPSAYCAHPQPSLSVHPSVGTFSAAVSDLSHTTSVTSASSTNDVQSIAVSSDVDTDVRRDDAHAACSTLTSDGTSAQHLIDSQVVDDDESTQDCDVSIAGTDAGEVLCTTGTQTSTPASGMSICNSVESAGDGTESNDTQPELQPDVVTGNIPAPRPSAAGDEKPPDDVHPEQMPVSTSAPVVLIPRVPQASFLLPQNIAFAPNPLVGHGFLQFQPPGEFGYGAAVQASGAGAVGQPGAVGLVHFATGPMVGPAVGNMMTTSDAGGSFRLMTPVKSDTDVYSAAEFLPLMPAAVPAGHILLQNIVPTGLASTIVPFVQPAALCSLPGGSSALFTVSQGSMMPVGAPLAFAPVPVAEQHHQLRDHAPDQPDSTVDNSEMDTTDERSSDDSADTEQVTSTEEPLDEGSDNATDSATKLVSSSATTLHCSTSHCMQPSLTKTTQCSTLECGGSTSTRPEYDSLRGDDVAGASSASCSTAGQRSRPLVPSLKKRAQLGRSRLKKKIRRGYGRSALPGTAVDQMLCSSSQSSLSVPTSLMMSSSTQDARNVDALMSPAGSDEFVDSLCSKDTVASDSSVSTTLSLHDNSNDSTDPLTAGKCSHAGSGQKVRWKKKQALARRTRLRLRHSKHEVKLPVDARLSTTEVTHVGEL